MMKLTFDFSNLLIEFEEKTLMLKELKKNKNADLYAFCKKNGFHSPFNARQASNFQFYRLNASEEKSLEPKH